MTDALGARPQLEEVIRLLHGITKIESGTDVYQVGKPTFTVVLTFDRAKSWGECGPTPTWLFEGILEQLQAWLRHRLKEEAWAGGESRFGASIDSHLMFMTELLKETDKRCAQAPNNIKLAMDRKLYAGVVLRLQELKERRAAGGVRSEWEDMREKARNAWAEDEFEAPKREEEQRRQRQKYAGPDWEHFDAFERAFTPTKPDATKRPWYEVLEVASDATDAEVEKAFRRQAKRYHPDRYKGADGHERMLEINAARKERLG